MVSEAAPALTLPEEFKKEENKPLSWRQQEALKKEQKEGYYHVPEWRGGTPLSPRNNPAPLKDIVVEEKPQPPKEEPPKQEPPKVELERHTCWCCCNLWSPKKKILCGFCTFLLILLLVLIPVIVVLSSSSEVQCGDGRMDVGCEHCMDRDDPQNPDNPALCDGSDCQWNPKEYTCQAAPDSEDSEEQAAPDSNVEQAAPDSEDDGGHSSSHEDHEEDEDPCKHPDLTPEEKPICQKIMKNIEEGKEPCASDDSACQQLLQKAMDADENENEEKEEENEENEDKAPADEAPADEAPADEAPADANSDPADEAPAKDD